MKNNFLKILLILSLVGSCLSSYALQLSSPAFKDNSPMPAVYACDDKNISPPLQWDNPPAGTKTYALVVNDPDAPTGNWYHWIVFNIPATTRAFIENIQTYPTNTVVSRNDWEREKYNGPCPPVNTHRYVFTLYALKAFLPLNQNAATATILKAIQDNTIASATLTGTYTR